MTPAKGLESSLISSVRESDQSVDFTAGLNPTIH